MTDMLTIHQTRAGQEGQRKLPRYQERQAAMVARSLGNKKPRVYTSVSFSTPQFHIIRWHKAYNGTISYSPVILPALG